MSDMAYIVRDLQRRLANMIKRGRVHSVDFTMSPPRVRVEYDRQAVTGWLPWIGGRASSSKTEWEPLDVGEQVIILSESGDLSAGVVMPSIPDGQSPVPSTSPDEHVSRYEDGTTLTYHRKEHTLTVDVQGQLVVNTTGDMTATVGGDLSATATKNISVIASENITVTATGDITAKADGNILADGKKIKLNSGAGVVTGECICPLTGKGHADVSTVVYAGKA